MQTIEHSAQQWAHEAYPPAPWSETRPLSEEVPYRYAAYIGLRHLPNKADSPEASSARISEMVEAQRIALLADALAQGMSGQDAWDYAANAGSESATMLAWSRAVDHGVDPTRIRAYPVAYFARP